MSSDLIANEHIRARFVRIVESAAHTGVLDTRTALMVARREGLDLVQIAEGDPPVCRLLDLDRYRYERAKQERENARRQRELVVAVKEVQLRTTIDANDLCRKAQIARTFLADGDKVRVVLRLRGRERAHRPEARRTFERFLAEVGACKFERPVSDSHEDLSAILAPLTSKADLLRQREGTADGDKAACAR